MVSYTRNELLQYRHGTRVPSTHILEEIWRCCRRGKRAGVKVREGIDRDRKFKPFLPSIIMGNVRSLGNKTDELSALINSQHAYRECSLLCFTETWLNGNIPDRWRSPGSRWGKQSSKKRGGGLAIFINSKWCNPGHVTVKECICTPDTELMAVGLRPYYLPQEFSHAIVVIIYIPPSAVASSASDVIHSVITGLQTQHPSALIIIRGDFNHVSLSPVPTNFKQYVNCATRENKTLDLLYVNVKGAYRSSPLRPLGESDHNLIHPPGVFPCHRLGSFQEEYGDDIEGLSHCITDYIRFCEDTIVPSKKVRCYPNNKPWIKTEIKSLLNGKKRAFMAKDRDELRAVQKELKEKTERGQEQLQGEDCQNGTEQHKGGVDWDETGDRLQPAITHSSRGPRICY